MPVPLILPYGIIGQIIDPVGEDKDTRLLKDLSLVSHSFHQICCKHLFATVELHDADPDADSNPHVASSKKGFLKLLKSKYIRKLTYEVSYYYDDDLRLSHILPKCLRTIPCLNCFTINGSRLDWNKRDSSLTSAFLYLMHLPTINHIDLSNIKNFPLSCLTPSVNLIRLDICYVDPLEEEVVVHSEMTPRIREFRTSNSTRLTETLLHAQGQDGQPAFNFMDLRQLYICLGDEQNIRYLLQNAKLLEELHLSTAEFGADHCLDGLHDILSVSAGILKVLDLSLLLYEKSDGIINLPFEELCEELEAMAGRNVLEVLSLEVKLYRDETADDIGSMFQNVEKVLVNPGWSSLRQVSFKVPIRYWLVKDSAELAEELQSLLPDKYLSRLSKLESVAFNFSSYVF